MDWNQLQINRDDRAILIGATGCGKTTLARYFIDDPNKRYSVVYDAKISDAIGKWTGHHFVYDYGEFEECLDDYEKYPRIIYRPGIYESLDQDAQDQFFMHIYERKRTRLYIDEAYAVLGGTNPSFHLQAILSRGRERGISTVIATQRPKRIPLLLKSESEHIYIFRLNLMEDRLAVWNITDIHPLEQAELRNHEFIYYNALTGERTGKLKLDLGVKSANAA